MNPRSEPLLWLQLIAVGVLPLEALLLLLLLAGSDPGPVPALERLLCWGLGALLPALGLWRRPADVWSLLLLQTPLRARRPLQQRLSALQEAVALRLGLGSGSALLLALLWWSDDHAAIAGPFSPLAESPRLVGLLLAALLLALMLWQWQQLLQSLWLLSRSTGAIAAATPMTKRDLELRRLCLGLPLLLLSPLLERLPESRPQPRAAQPHAPEPGSIVAATARATRPADPPSVEQEGALATGASETVPAESHGTFADPGPKAPQEPSGSVTAQAEANALAKNGAAAASLASPPAAASTPATASREVPQLEPIRTVAPPLETPPDSASAAAPSDSEAGDPENPDPAARSHEPPLLESQVIAAGPSDQGEALSPAADPEATPRVAIQADPLIIDSIAAATTAWGSSADRAQTNSDAATEAGDTLATSGAATLEGSPGPDEGEPGLSDAVPIAIEPEQGAEQGQGGDLDQQIG